MAGPNLRAYPYGEPLDHDGYLLEHDHQVTTPAGTVGRIDAFIVVGGLYHALVEVDGICWEYPCRELEHGGD